MKRIAVLMTCYNRVGTTLECLRRLFAQEVPDGYSLDVWLVDDASPDKTGEKVKEAFPQVNVIRGNGKLFWCRGMRLAWDSASEAYDYDFYLWLNDDAMLEDGALGRVMGDYERLLGECRQGVVIVGAFADREGSDVISYSAGSEQGVDIVPSDSGPTRASGYFGGNFVLVPKLVYERVGPISNLYHHGAGDFDYARLLTRKGIPFYVASRTCGWCNKSGKKAIRLSGLKFKERMSLLWDPLGYHIGDAFVFHFRHDGVLKALLSACHIFFVALFAIDNRKRSSL